MPHRKLKPSQPRLRSTTVDLNQNGEQAKTMATLREAIENGDTVTLGQVGTRLVQGDNAKFTVNALMDFTRDTAYADTRTMNAYRDTIANGENLTWSDIRDRLIQSGDNNAAVTLVMGMARDLIATKAAAKQTRLDNQPS